jgi:hypothetical protein
MSKPARKTEAELDVETEKSGPNLFLLYTLLALGILAAMAFAAMVVWPFYQRK